MTKLRPGIVAFHGSSGTVNLSTSQSFTVPRCHTLVVEMWGAGGAGGYSSNYLGGGFGSFFGASAAATTCAALGLSTDAAGGGGYGQGTIGVGAPGALGHTPVPSGGDVNTPGGNGNNVGFAGTGHGGGGTGAFGGGLFAGNGGQAGRGGADLGSGGPVGGTGGNGGGYLMKTYTVGSGVHVGDVLAFVVGDPGVGTPSDPTWGGQSGSQASVPIRLTWS